MHTQFYVLQLSADAAGRSVFKVGVTNNLGERLRGIGQGCPHVRVLLHLYLQPGEADAVETHAKRRIRQDASRRLCSNGSTEMFYARTDAEAIDFAQASLRAVCAPEPAGGRGRYRRHHRTGDFLKRSVPLGEHERGAVWCDRIRKAGLEAGCDDPDALVKASRARVRYYRDERPGRLDNYFYAEGVNGELRGAAAVARALLAVACPLEAVGRLPEPGSRKRRRPALVADEEE